LDSFVRQCNSKINPKYILYVESLGSLYLIRGVERQQFNELHHTGKKLNKAENKALMDSAKVIATAYKARFSD